MCVTSMIYDHYYEKWNNGPGEPHQIPMIPYQNPYIHYQPIIVDPNITLPTLKPTITDEEIKELLKKARKYDQPESKKKKLKDLADKLGVKIDFI